MLFGTFDFFIFLAVIIILNSILKPHKTFWRVFLLLISIYFYALIDIKFVLLLGIISTITFLLGLSIKKKFAFPLGLLLNLGTLFIFKYYDFFRVTAESFFASINLNSCLPYWQIIFPVGISFYTFRMISYLFDLKRGKYKAEKSFLNFSVYSFFFPYLLAGPIVRANDFLDQLKNKSAVNLEKATTLFFIGLFKKIVLSSWLSSTLVDDVFAVPEQFSLIAILLAVLGYSLVIYCDFSGYSDMAIAVSNFLGFNIKENFLFPYKAKSITDFWRRWHISFYSWMKDYLYIPLGGNRVSKFRSYLNVLIVFAFSGLWHGAALHFLFWGLWHGIGMITHRIWSTVLKKSTGFLGGIITFIFVSFGWIFFKAENMERALALIKGLWQNTKVTTIPISVILITTLITLFILYEEKIINKINKIQLALPNFIWIIFWISASVIIYKLAPNTVPPFIYFSF
ncbi:MAG: MBOAT family O-acyltransferase [Candidatus Paceibacterota bacterium]